MSKYQVGSLAYKLAGLFAVVQSTSMLPWLSSVLQASATQVYSHLAILSMLFLCSVPILALMTGGIFLIKKSDALAAKSFQAEEIPEDKYSQNNSLLLPLAVLGAILISFGVSSLAADSANLFYVRMYAASLPPIAPSQALARIIGSAVQLLVGAYLFIGGRSVARFWHWVRTRQGRNSDEPVHEDMDVNLDGRNTPHGLDG